MNTSNRSRKSDIIELVLYRTAFIFWSATVASICLAQEATIEFLPPADGQEFEVVEFTLLPNRAPLKDDDRNHQIQYRFHSKTLPGEWVMSKEEELSTEELFVKTVVATYQNLQSVVELQSVLDEPSFDRRQEIYATLDNEIEVDRNRYSTWSDVRPFSLVRYGNIYLILCDIRMDGDSDELAMEVLETVLENGKYILTDALDLNESFDVVSNGFFQPGIGDGRLLSALRSRAGIY